MSRIYKIDKIIVDLERITAIDKSSHDSYKPVKVYLHGGGYVTLERVDARVLSEAWEEYMKDKEVYER